MGNQAGKAILAFPAHFNLGEKKGPKMNECGQTLLGIGHLVHPSSGRRERSRPGVSPFISALTGSCRPATFPGVATHLVTVSRSFGTFCPIGRGRRTRDGGFHNTPCLLLKSALCFGLPAPNKALLSCRVKCPCPPRRQRYFQATPTERITHSHSCSANVCQMGRCPL